MWGLRFDRLGGLSKEKVRGYRVLGFSWTWDEGAREVIHGKSVLLEAMRGSIRRREDHLSVGVVTGSLGHGAEGRR